MERAALDAIEPLILDVAARTPGNVFADMNGEDWVVSALISEVTDCLNEETICSGELPRMLRAALTTELVSFGVVPNKRAGAFLCDGLANAITKALVPSAAAVDQPTTAPATSGEAHLSSLVDGLLHQVLDHVPIRYMVVLYRSCQALETVMRARMSRIASAADEGSADAKLEHLEMRLCEHFSRLQVDDYDECCSLVEFAFDPIYRGFLLRFEDGKHFKTSDRSIYGIKVVKKLGRYGEQMNSKDCLWVEIGFRGDKGAHYLCCDLSSPQFGCVAEFYDSVPCTQNGTDADRYFGSFSKYLGSLR